MGNNYPLAINRNQSSNSIEIVDGKFSVHVKSAELSGNILQKLYENWIAEKAQHIFDNKVRRYSKKLGVRVILIVIKNLKNRWGSLTKKDVINLNVNLLKAPEAVIDYIILHELCHLRIKDHSHHYWDLVHRFMPNYQDKIEWLKANGDNLFLR
jgi:predicted metal-dependent hydrolase